MEKTELIASLKAKGFSQKVINAFQKVERADFIPKEYQPYAYVDGPLPIGRGATISQPLTIAYMLEWLELDDEQKILEIGSGSGYVLALIDQIVSDGQIFGVEINAELVTKSQKLLAQDNIAIVCKNGFDGLSEKGPYDRILVSAAFAQKPEHLLAQLKEDGILVTPVGSAIYKFVKKGPKIEEQVFPGFAFVSMQEE